MTSSSQSQLKGSVTEIYIYPIKSLAGIKLDRALVTKYGLAHPDNTLVIDRKWMVVDAETGSFLTQRQLPKMALIKPRLDGDHLVLSAPNATADLRVPISPPKTTKKECRVWNMHINGYLYGGEIAKWLSRCLDRENLDLACFNDEFDPRPCKRLREDGKHEARENDRVIYSDYSPIMLISEASLVDLNARLEKKVSMRNFRPNLVSASPDADQSMPFAEDSWKKFSIGPQKFTKIKECTRCLLTTVDPDKGEKDKNQQPLKTLKEYRMNKELYGDSPMFGINIAGDDFADDSSAQSPFITIGDQIKSI